MKAFFIFKNNEVFGSPIGYTTEKGAIKSLIGCDDWHNLRKNYKHYMSNDEITDEMKSNGFYKKTSDSSGWLLNNAIWTNKVWKPFVKENYEIIEKEFEILFKD